MNKRIIAAASLIFALLSVTSAKADPIELDTIPPELKDWVPWVLHDNPERNCPDVEGSKLCHWPGFLSFELSKNGGVFVQKIVADSDTYISLPGDDKLWPLEVRANGEPVVVLKQQTKPSVFLTAGTWIISGHFAWSQMPEGISVPLTTALINLSIDNKIVSFPRRDPDGLLWLDSSQNQAQEGDRLDLEVVRMIADGVPVQVITRLVLRASGKAREVDLGRVLLSNTTVLSVTADLPARVDAEGHLKVQVRAGTHNLEIVARADFAFKEITSTKPKSGWPDEEIWLWQSNDLLRQVAVSGPPSIDPSRANIPPKWQGLPAFIVTGGDKMILSVSRQGEPNPPPDQISLRKIMWMDLDGGGFTVQDTLSGKLNRTWRLDLEQKGSLGHVLVNGTDQLITANNKNKNPGVELRSGNLNLTAEWRIEGGSKTLPAVGWSQDVQSLNTLLHTPPGWTLISASGVDNLPGTWWDEWDLFHFFFVLLVAGGIGKLTKWYFGVLALITLVLTHQQSDAPFIIWIFLLLSLGLLKILPRTRLYIAGKSLWWILVAALVIIMIPFSVDQVRTGLYPQIDKYTDMDISIDAMEYQNNEPLAEEKSKQEALIPPQIQQKRMETTDYKEVIQQADDLDEEILDELKSVGYLASNRGDRTKWKKSGHKLKKSLQQDPTAVVQTGPGIPRWQWHSWDLSWSGPVNKDHKITLYMISPGLNLALSILRVIFLIILGGALIRQALRIIKSKPDSDDNESPKISKQAAILTVLFLSLPASGPAQAEELPNPTLLSELESRLTRQPDCTPDCISTSTVDIKIENKTLTLTSQVHAGALSSFKLPGPASNWVPGTVTIDGSSTFAMSVQPDGFLHIRLEPGIHTVVAKGPAPPSDAVTLEFSDLTHKVTTNAPGWEVQGLRDDGTTEGSVQLTKLAVADSDIDPNVALDKKAEENAYPPWLEIKRTFDLGIPWLVHTTVKRVSPTGTPVITKFPLLKGEAVIDSELQVENGSVVISLGRDEIETSWSATLEETQIIKLQAGKNSPWTQIWEIETSPIWRCELDGIAPVVHKVGDILKPTFHPWPGETLQLTMLKPEGIEGQSITVDSANLIVSPGKRLLKASLELQIRSSSGGVQTVTIPKNATVQNLTVNGIDRPFREGGNKLAVNLKPGKQSIHIQWQQPGGISSMHRVAQVNIGSKAANAKVVVNLPSDRWLIWTGGPSWGPAILFWGFLFVILISGFILGYIPYSPLKGWQWALLALGLTQIPVVVALIIVSWFFILSWRKTNPPKHFILHNALQVVIIIWTAVGLGCLFFAVYKGLLVQPDMQVSGTGSSNTNLSWYMDRIDKTMPTPWVLSLPDLIWKGIMLCWALWLAYSLLFNWARWGWKSFSHELLWRSIPKPPKPAPSVNTTTIV